MEQRRHGLRVELYGFLVPRARGEDDMCLAGLGGWLGWMDGGGGGVAEDGRVGCVLGVFFEGGFYFEGARVVEEGDGVLFGGSGGGFRALAV